MFVNLLKTTLTAYAYVKNLSKQIKRIDITKLEATIPSQTVATTQAKIWLFTIEIKAVPAFHVREAVFNKNGLPCIVSFEHHPALAYKESTKLAILTPTPIR